MYQESSQRPLPVIPRSHSPPSQLMSGSHRGLPPPSAMGLGQPLPPGVGSHLPPPPGSSIGQGTPAPPPPPPQALQQQGLGQHLGQLPPPPGWQGSEESMRAWLQAKAEEEKRKQEEERTNQERLRLEQRRTEYDILRASLQGGIPPPMVPVVFAGMGGGNLPPSALEWAQQFTYSQAQHGPPQQLLPGPTSPEHRRDSQAQAYGHYPGSGGVPSTPGSAQGVHGGFVGSYPSSPPARTRGYTMPSSGSRPLGGSGLSSLNTSVLPSSGGAAAAQSHPGIASAQQHEPQQSPSIYFHMWQPPTSQGSQSGSNQPATPSVGESPRKRKATGPQQAAPPPSTQQRYRSPPFAHSAGSALSNPPPGRRRGHSRQTSEASTYRGRGRAETIGSTRGMSPLAPSGPSSARGTGRGSAEPSAYSQQQATQARSTAHSVSSLLSSDDPSAQTAQYPPAPAANTRGQQGRGDSRQNSPHSGDERSRVGGAGSAGPRERDNE